LSKVEAGKLELQLEPLGVVDICHASLALVREVAIQKHIQLSFRCDDLGLYLLADAKRLKQILVNLLSNAVKFTPEGGRVWLEVIADEPQNQVHISVRDTGVGIAPENMGRLFRPFTQLDSGLTRQHEGTGLGLALVKRLTELHGGSVAASSTGLPGQGSCFTVALPWRQLGHALAEGQDRAAIAGELSEGSSALAQASGLHERQSQPERRPLILLAEDNEINILVIEDYVDSLGYRLVVARNGQEAIERALEQHPDLILMDIHMPVLDGLEATRRLRAMPEFATTPIIALTALAMPSDRDLCMQAGATEYVSKPLSLKALAVLMRQLLGTEKP
jgi:CheY-like chemotaxis protein